MSNPTELPDLDRLPPCPFCGVHLEIERDDGINFYDHPSGDCILSGTEIEGDRLHAWNRRAQPEGEAPQAERDAILEEAANLIEMMPCSRDSVQPMLLAAKAIRALKITAPAAQHADSGAQAWDWDRRAKAARDFLANYADTNMEVLLDGYAVQPIIRRLAAAIEEWQLAAQCQGAQQAAAPGALDADELAALRRFDETCQDGEGYDVPKEMMQRLAAIGVVRRTSGSFYQQTDFGLRVLGQDAHSAPGTPEAPAEPEYELHQDDMMVAGTSGKRAYEEILRYAEQYAQDGPIELHKVVRTKIAIPRAAQLDGGQGEGE